MPSNLKILQCNKLVGLESIAVTLTFELPLRENHCYIIFLNVEGKFKILPGQAFNDELPLWQISLAEHKRAQHIECPKVVPEVHLLRYSYTSPKG